MTLTGQENLTGEILRATYEALDLGDFGSQVLPLVDRLFDTSTSLLYWCNNQHQIVPLAGAMVESVAFYSNNYFSEDLLQKNLLRFNPWVLHGAAMPDWKEYLSSPAYHECATRNDIDNFLHLRISDCAMYEPGMVGIMIARTFRQPDFSERERMLMGNLMPAFESFARRYLRMEDRLKANPFLESLVEYSRRPTVVLDSRGGFLWASEEADKMLRITKNGRKSLPEGLVKAALELARLLGKRSKIPFPQSAVDIPRKDSDPIHVELRLIRNKFGAPYIAAELETPEPSAHLMAVAAANLLTKAETQVLKWIASGLSDRQIGRRLFVSPSTVHSHVNHILAKLGVGSRIQAALIALGQEAHFIGIQGKLDSD